MVPIQTTPQRQASSPTSRSPRGLVTGEASGFVAEVPSLDVEVGIGVRGRGRARGMGMRYRADLTAGSIKLRESRVIADLLLRKTDPAGWREAVVESNVLQARSPATAVRLARLIRLRLETMDADLWGLVRDGTGIEATHAVLAAAVKHSPLLGDFLDLV